MLGWALRPIQPAPALELPVVTTQRAAGQHAGRPDGCRATLMVARDRRGRPGRGDRYGVGDRYRRAARRGRRVAADPAEAKIIFGVLELGSDGVLMAARAVGDATRLIRSASATTGSIELTVTATADIGSGERACVDTCAYLAKDEGMLVGSHSKGMVLCVSETHPLPYMATRPFRVNAVVGRGRWLSLVELFGAAWTFDRAQRSSRPAMMWPTTGIASHMCSELWPFSSTKVSQIFSNIHSPVLPAGPGRLPAGSSPLDHGDLDAQDTGLQTPQHGQRDGSTLQIHD